MFFSHQYIDMSEINESSELYIPFGNKFLYAPSLLKNKLSMRTVNKGYPKGWRTVDISQQFKNIILDIIYKNKFEESAYNSLSDEE